MANAKIISVSRRTDIPAFFGEWFINRIKEGFVDARNPFNHHYVSRISLKQEDVIGFVFWTKNATPFMKHLHLLDEMGYDYYFQYTITPYNQNVEEKIAHQSQEIIKNFIELSNRIGKERVIWRFDPILLNNEYDVQSTIHHFEQLANVIAPYTNKVIFSFLDRYQKTERNTKHLHLQTITDHDMLTLSEQMSNIATKYGLTLETCSETIDLDHLNIKHGKCIDGQLFKHNSIKRDKNQRTACGCVESIDIGASNTCSHYCAYCYANVSKRAVMNNLNKHNPNSSLLIGELSGKETIHWRNGNESKNKQ